MLFNYKIIPACVPGNLSRLQEPKTHEWRLQVRFVDKSTLNHLFIVHKYIFIYISKSYSINIYLYI